MFVQNKRRAFFNLLIISQYHTKCFYCKFYKNLCEGCFITNYRINIIITRYTLTVRPSALEKRLTRFEVINNRVGPKPARG